MNMLSPYPPNRTTSPFLSMENNKSTVCDGIRTLPPRAGSVTAEVNNPTGSDLVSMRHQLFTPTSWYSCSKLNPTQSTSQHFLSFQNSTSDIFGSLPGQGGCTSFGTAERGFRGAPRGRVRSHLRCRGLPHGPGTGWCDISKTVSYGSAFSIGS